MLLGNVLVLLFSLAMMASILMGHFGSYRAMFFVLRGIWEGKISFRSFLKDEIFEMSTIGFASFVMAIILLVVAFGLFAAVILPNFASHIINALFVFGIFTFGVSYGGIAVIRKDTGGMFPWKGTLAIIFGWIFIIVSSLFAFLFFWKSFVEGVK